MTTTGDELRVTMATTVMLILRDKLVQIVKMEICRNCILGDII